MYLLEMFYTNREGFVCPVITMDM